MTYQKAPDISVRAIDGEVFILDRASSVVHTFNRSGAHIWQELAAGKPEAAICESVCEKFDVAVDQARTDIHELIELLLAKNLLRSADAA